jgi:hypothetical protein
VFDRESVHRVLGRLIRDGAGFTSSYTEPRTRNPRANVTLDALEFDEKEL